MHPLIMDQVKFEFSSHFVSQKSEKWKKAHSFLATTVYCIQITKGWKLHSTLPITSIYFLYIMHRSHNMKIAPTRRRATTRTRATIRTTLTISGSGLRHRQKNLSPSISCASFGSNHDRISFRSFGKSKCSKSCLC